MWTGEIIMNGANKALKETFIGKTIKFEDLNIGEVIITVKDVCLNGDDGDYWIEFSDENNKKYTLWDQSELDLYYEML